MPAIVQLGTYVYPLGVVDPNRNVTMPNVPIAGNVLIAAVPIDYTSEGFPLNPYWNLIVHQTDVDETFPMNWLAHIIVANESNVLPPFYDGFTVDNFSEYAGAAVWEVSGISTDFSAVPNAYLLGQDAANLPLPAFTAVPNNLPLGYVQTHDTTPGPPFTPITVLFWTTLAFVTPSPAAENLNNFSFAALTHFPPSTTPHYSASFSPAPAQSFVSAIALAPAQILPIIVITEIFPTPLPCVPCLTMDAKYPF